MSSKPHNNSPDNASPDDSTPDNSTPDDADNSSSPPSQSPPPSSPPPSSPPPSSTPPSPPPPSSPPPSSSSSPPSPPPPPSSNNPSPPSPNGSPQSPPPPTSTRSPPSFESPPHKSLQPPSHQTDGASRSGSKNGGGSSGNNTGSGGGGSGNDDNSKAIVGAVLGVGSVLLILVIVCVVCSRRKKKKRMYYYGPGEQSLGGKGNNYAGNNYYNSGQHPGYYGNPHGDHVVRVQNGMGPGGGGGPPPPPMMMNSADMSSNYSTGPTPLPPPSPTLALGLKGGTFSYEELAAATNGFADVNLIGQGGFGYVHKGVLPNGKEVAVKSLKSGSGQGEREFQAEIDIISRVHHRHLVSLVGYCISGGQRMLVYEFIPNNTLEYHLHGKGRPTMDWPTRMRIAIGSAKGLAYLHEDCHPRIIHRDIKAANVLIDDSFEAKVADFGLAKLTTDNNTHVSTRVMGTFGYLAPEYASSGKLTEKSDVFSFGVMLLELVTGKRPVDHTNVMDDSLVDWARPLLTRGLEEDGNFGELVDPFLEGNYNPQELSRMAACAAASIRHSSKKRPKMSQIVRILEGDVSLDDLKDGIRPGQNAIYNSSGSSDQYDTMQYNADLQKFRKAVFSNSDEFGTSSGSSAEVSQRQPRL
uniref:non-specific serine/threonine protein kinase n=1 Tax=Cajanus cajan TaxID=3821 RepID=A0A151TI56_CAJCA|nr:BRASSINOSTEROID INSENSITIVE 1-associated receptor kinase 1 [Cajanus cajan]